MRLCGSLAIFLGLAACTPPRVYLDRDGDGFTSEVDCADDDALAFSGASERCNGQDDDCDGEIDEGVSDMPTWYADDDGDGRGDPELTEAACVQPLGHVSNADDCDDGDSGTFPGAAEDCDGLDDDCDGAVDESGAIGEELWFADADGDGWGTVSESTYACDAPEGFTGTSGDCDDTRAAAFPGAPEVCNGRDDDCDGSKDEEAVDMTYWYRDLDGDGFGNDPKVQACAAPTGYVAANADCDDGDPAVHPGADERCNDEDDDCDGATDEDAVDPKSWLRDADGDGYGTSDDKVRACAPPSGYIRDGGDCDDAKAAIHPGATEIWYDGVDQDCDGRDDYDQDGDGARAKAHGGTDCDDTNAAYTTVCPPDGLTRAKAAETCRYIKSKYASSPDGKYWIDPDRDGDTSDAFQAFCDMTTAGGGWTLLAWSHAANAWQGVPYPGINVCGALSCTRGSAMNQARAQELIRLSAEFGQAQSTSTRSAIEPMGKYTYVGRYAYSSLSAVTLAAPTATCAQQGSGVFRNVSNMAGYDGVAVWFSRSLHAVPALSSSYSDTGTYYWSVGIGGSPCQNTTPSRPGSLLGSFSGFNAGPGNPSGGSFAVFVR